MKRLSVKTIRQNFMSTLSLRTISKNYQLALSVHIFTRKYPYVLGSTNCYRNIHICTRKYPSELNFLNYHQKVSIATRNCPFVPASSHSNKLSENTILFHNVHIESVKFSLIQSFIILLNNCAQAVWLLIQFKVAFH